MESYDKKTCCRKLVKKIVSFFKTISYKIMNKILFKTLDNGKDLYKPEKATLGSAGFDLVAQYLMKYLLNHETLLIPCGFSLELPKSFEAQVRPRSGIALKTR